MIIPWHLIHPCSQSIGHVPWHVSPWTLTPVGTHISSSLHPSSSSSPRQRCSVSLQVNGHCWCKQYSPLLFIVFGIQRGGTEQWVTGSSGTSHSFSLYSHSSGQKPGQTLPSKPWPFSTHLFATVHPLSSTPPGHSSWVTLWQLASQITGQTSPSSPFSGP